MEASLNLPGQMLFEGNVSCNWEKYKQKFLFYLEASEKTNKPDKLKIALLLNQMGDQAVDIYNTFHFENGTSRDAFDDVIKKFD